MKKYGCIGKKLTHSFSKEIHKALADYEYELIELAEDEIASFFCQKDFEAINVTIPYKQTVMPYLYSVSDIAKRIGAVNTIVNRNGRLYGYNTDYYGMKALIERIGLSLCGKKVMILGTGGTAKTARVVAEDMGAAEILTVSRSKNDEYISYSDAVTVHFDTEIIINTTPSGMYPDTEAKPIDIAALDRLEGVVDAVYNPLRTNLVLDAKARGLKAEGGLYMLVMQAVVAVEKFLDTKIEKLVADRIFEEIFFSKENIVLTGMPGSGKSTVGKLLGIDGYEFFDTDAEIEKRCGCTIKELIAEKGEKYFRDLESEVISDISKESGRIIATGGGAVLREENVRALKRNGKVFFLNAELSRLVATDDRPLSNTREKLEKLYSERIDIYKATADLIVPDMKTATAEAEYILANRIPKRVNQAVFTPSKLCGSVSAPPSKSMAHRYLIGAALSGEKALLRGVQYSEDILATIDCLRTLGVKITTENDTVAIDPEDFMKAENPILNCRESGSTLRFFIPLALCLGKSVTLCGSERLFLRPLTVYEELCKENGFLFQKDKNSVTLCGRLENGSYKIRGDISSQFITGLIFALVYLNKTSVIEILPPFESRSYIDLTISALKSFGARVEFTDDLKIEINPAKLSSFSGKIEGDYSNAAFLDAFNHIGSSVRIENLKPDSLQGDRVYADYFEKISGGRPTLDISDCPDLGPVLIALAALKNGAVFIGTDRLKIKESDRGAAMHEELSKLGGGLVFGENEITVPKQNLKYKGEALDGHNDHRIVMAMSVILTTTGGCIKGIDAVKKSYPEFFADIKELGAKVELL